MKYRLIYIRNGKQRNVDLFSMPEKSLIEMVMEHLDEDCTDPKRLFTLLDSKGNTILTEENLF